MQDVDWVPPKPAPVEGGGQVQEKEKKKKKEKTEGKLRPKLNFAVQTVQGSYYGSNNNREEVRGGKVGVTTLLWPGIVVHIKPNFGISLSLTFICMGNTPRSNKMT